MVNLRDKEGRTGTTLPAWCSYHLHMLPCTHPVSYTHTHTHTHSSPPSSSSRQCACHGGTCKLVLCHFIMTHSVHSSVLPSYLFPKTSTAGVRCDVSAVDLQFRTPLHWAAVLGLGEVVGMLMERGADPACVDAVGATALHYAVSEGCVQSQNLLHCLTFSLSFLFLLPPSSGTKEPCGEQNAAYIHLWHLWCGLPPVICDLCNVCDGLLLCDLCPYAGVRVCSAVISWCQ